MANPFDTHTHLDFSQFDADRDQVLKESLSLLSGFIAVGTDPETSESAIKLARSSRRIGASVGIHPTSASEAGLDAVQKLNQMAQDEDVVAIGECGFDFHREPYSEDQQRLVFTRQIDLALELNLPLIIHLRDAYSLGWKTLHKNYISEIDRQPGVIHSFAGDLQTANKFLDDGWLLGINNMITYPENQGLRGVVRETTLDQLVLETDCPFLPPQSDRGGRCEPKNVADVAEKIAEVKKMDQNEVINKTTQNAKHLFDL